MGVPRRLDSMIVTAIALSIACAGCATEVPTPTPTVASDTPTVVPASPSPTETENTNNDPLGGLWRAMSHRFADPSNLIGFDLGVGSFDGAMTIVQRRFDPINGDRLRWSLPVATGPTAGIVAFAYGIGGSSELWVVDVATGKESPIAERPAGVLALTLDAKSQRLFSAESAPFADELTIAVTDLASGDSTVVGSVASGIEDGGAVDLAVDASARHLVAMSCGLACRLTSFDLADGESVWDRPSDFSRTTATDTNEILLTRGCGIPCPVQLLDPATGEGGRSGQTCSRAVLVPGNEVLLATDSDGADCEVLHDPESSIHGYAIESSDESFAIAIRPGYALVANGSESGYDLPPGWVVLAPGGGLVPMLDGTSQFQLLSVPDGRLVAG